MKTNCSDFSGICEIINKFKTFAIYSHMHTDIDAIGSSLAMKKLLEKLGVSEDDYSDYRYLSSGAVNSELGLENIDRSIIVNIKTKKIYSLTPAKYNNELYYSADDLRDSLK